MCIVVCCMLQGSIYRRVLYVTGIVPRDDDGKIMRAQGEIEFVAACFTYPRNSDRTLNGATFKVKRGEFVGLTGETGSGKSTTLLP